ncbi:MAG: HlyD family efflux transporter periplasmic adaptor subunit [Planctomycetota bacterium]
MPDVNPLTQPVPDSDTSVRDDPAGSSGSGYDVVTSAASPNQIARPKRWDQYILVNVAVPILLLLSGVAVVVALGEAKPKPVPPPESTREAVLQTMLAARVERVQTLAETGKQLELVIDGSVVPYHEARVAAEVAGRVVFKSDNCNAGSFVREGDVLMRIDPTDMEMEVERLTRLREQEYRGLGEVDQEMTNTTRSLEVARADVDLKRKEVERQQSLKTFASQSEVDASKSSLLQASQQLVTLENQMSLLRARRSKLEASEQYAATQLRVAEINLRRCEITAPISGVIVSEEAELDMFVNRGTRLVTIENTDRVEVSASMRMDQLHWVLDQAGDVDFKGYDLPDTPAIIEYEVAGRDAAVLRWEGKLVSYDGIGLDPNTRTVPVRLVVDNPKRYVDASGKLRESDRTNALMRGMFVRVRLQLTPKTPLIVIPARALRPGNKVWKFTPDEKPLEDLIAKAVEQRTKAAEAAAKEGDSKAKLESTEKSIATSEVALQDKLDSKSSSTESSDAAKATVTTSAESKFDAASWSPGLVTYSDVVYPVESLRLGGTVVTDPSISPSLQAAGRDWVCEAGQLDLAGGSFVVVSPLNSIPPEGLPARAQLKSDEGRESAMTADTESNQL